MIRKYSVMFNLCDCEDFDCEHNWKSYGEIAQAAEEINELSAAIAPYTYMMLCIHANKIKLEYDTFSSAGLFFETGIEALVKLGYIEIGECKADEYKVIKIVK